MWPGPCLFVTKTVGTKSEIGRFGKTFHQHLSYPAPPTLKVSFWLEHVRAWIQQLMIASIIRRERLGKALSNPGRLCNDNICTYVQLDDIRERWFRFIFRSRNPASLEGFIGFVSCTISFRVPRNSQVRMASLYSHVWTPPSFLIIFITAYWHRQEPLRYNLRAQPTWMRLINMTVKPNAVHPTAGIVFQLRLLSLT